MPTPADFSWLALSPDTPFNFYLIPIIGRMGTRLWRPSQRFATDEHR